MQLLIRLAMTLTTGHVTRCAHPPLFDKSKAHGCYAH